jgi:hypothetical protein
MRTSCMTLGMTLGISIGLAALSGCGGSDGADAPVAAPTTQRTIIMVWDGLRPDSVNPTDTPNLCAMRQQGREFRRQPLDLPDVHDDERLVLCDGSFPKTSGFYGSTLRPPSRACSGSRCRRPMGAS